ncbi:hypothetical protein SLS60_008292 [Paraconiothyrium brasiliense]|uniref:Uncharacterized protein n=1 Tax=Paraconiothyrium brasiliense TaxID=300254 RepID=A0ABR3R063_9PLEO
MTQPKEDTKAESSDTGLTEWDVSEEYERKDYKGPEGSRKMAPARGHRPRTLGNIEAPPPATLTDIPSSKPATKAPAPKSGSSEASLRKPPNTSSYKPSRTAPTSSPKPKAPMEIPGLKTLKHPGNAAPEKQKSPEDARATGLENTKAPEATKGPSSPKPSEGKLKIFSMKKERKSTKSLQPSTTNSEPATTSDMPSTTKETSSTTTKQPEQQRGSDSPKPAVSSQTEGSKSTDVEDSKTKSSAKQKEVASDERESQASAPVASATTGQSQGSSQFFGGGNLPSFSDIDFGFQGDNETLQDNEYYKGEGARRKDRKVGGRQNVVKSAFFGEHATFKRNNTAPTADTPNPLKDHTKDQFTFEMSTAAPTRSGPTPLQTAPGGAVPGSNLGPDVKFRRFELKPQTGASAATSTDPTPPAKSTGYRSRSSSGHSLSSTEDMYRDDKNEDRKADWTIPTVRWKKSREFLNPEASSSSDRKDARSGSSQWETVATNPDAKPSGSVGAFHFGNRTFGQIPGHTAEELARNGGRDPDDTTIVRVSRPPGDFNFGSPSAGPSQPSVATPPENQAPSFQDPDDPGMTDAPPFSPIQEHQSFESDLME